MSITELFGINELYKDAVKKLEEENDPILFIAAYYYVASTIGYSEISGIFNECDSNWRKPYGQYVAPARIRPSAEKLITSMKPTFDRLAKQNPDSMAVKVYTDPGNQKKYRQTIERSNIGQPEYSGIAVSFYEENKPELAGILH